MEKGRLDRTRYPLWRHGEDLRATLKVESTQDIVKRVSNNFAAELAAIMNKAKDSGSTDQSKKKK